MKLRNKKTGNIYTLSENLYIEYTQGGKIEVRAIIPGGNMSYYYDSLDKLNEDWEDVKEPLIKDEEIISLLRPWIKFNEIEKATILKVSDCWFHIRGKDSNYCWWDIEIHASYSKSVDKDYGGELVDIAELCGEEKE